MAEMAGPASCLQSSRLSGCGNVPPSEISSKIAARANGVELVDASMIGRTLLRKRV
jgi:hypothetical protein